MSYTFITDKDATAYTKAADVPATFGQGPRTIEGITIHHWGDPSLNPTFEGIVAYLTRPGATTSAHYVATGTGRRVACIVAPADAAWHSGDAWGNAKTIGIELDPRARDEDYDVAAELIADIRSAYGDVPIYWHSYFIKTACPGAWDPERLDKLSYTKYSHPTEWGQGGDITPKAPVPAPAPVTPAPAPQPVPSPTAGQLDSGKPVAEKDGYSEADRQRDNETNSLVKQILAIAGKILDKLFSVFK